MGESWELSILFINETATGSEEEKAVKVYLVLVQNIQCH